MKNRGLSLVELVVAMLMFLLLTAVAFFAMKQATKVHTNVSARQDAAIQLRKAVLRLQADVRQTQTATTASTRCPSSLPGAGADGDAFWCLSALDASTGEFVRRADGTPFWQRNILYYVTVPQEVNAIAGYQVTGGVGAGGYDEHCPYKILVRKVIDTGPATDPTDEANLEALISDPTIYLTRPLRYTLDGMLSEPGVKSVDLVARRLVRFRSSGTTFDLRSVALEDAERTVKIGQVSLAEGSFTLQNRLAIKPRN